MISVQILQGSPQLSTVVLVKMKNLLLGLKSSFFIWGIKFISLKNSKTWSDKGKTCPLPAFWNPNYSFYIYYRLQVVEKRQTWKIKNGKWKEKTGNPGNKDKITGPEIIICSLSITAPWHAASIAISLLFSLEHLVDFALCWKDPTYLDRQCT